MSASITSRLRPFLLLLLIGCGGPQALDTGPSVIDLDRPGPKPLWQRDLGRGLEFRPVPHQGSWLTVVTAGPAWRLDQITGETIWKQKLPGSPRQAPIVLGDLVVIVTDYDDPRLLGLRFEDGETVWSLEIGLAYAAANDSLIVVAERGGTVLRVDPSTGDPLWETPLTGCGWSAPVLRADLGLAIVPFRPDSVAAFDLAGGKRRWSVGVGPWPAVSATGEAVLTVGDDSTLTALDPATGEVLVRRHVTAIPSGPPPVQDGIVYLALRDGTLTALTEGTLEPVWSRNFEPPLVAPPTVLPNRLFQIAPEGTIHVLDRASGEVLATVPHPESIVAPPGADSTFAAVAGVKGLLVAYRRGS